MIYQTRLKAAPVLPTCLKAPVIIVVNGCAQGSTSKRMIPCTVHTVPGYIPCRSNSALLTPSGHEAKCKLTAASIHAILNIPPETLSEDLDYDSDA
jgi:hypothetical protein